MLSSEHAMNEKRWKAWKGGGAELMVCLHPFRHVQPSPPPFPSLNTVIPRTCKAFGLWNLWPMVEGYASRKKRNFYGLITWMTNPPYKGPHSQLNLTGIRLNNWQTIDMAGFVLTECTMYGSVQYMPRHCRKKFVKFLSCWKGPSNWTKLSWSIHWYLKSVFLILGLYVKIDLHKFVWVV